MTEGEAAAEELPEFSDLLEYVEVRSPDLHEWALAHEPDLRAAYNEARAQVGRGERRAQDFAVERTYSALLRVARVRVAGVVGFRRSFRRPCCTKMPFTYPFCNPGC